VQSTCIVARLGASNAARGEQEDYDQGKVDRKAEA
jgi:hypothetical protein